MPGTCIFSLTPVGNKSSVLDSSQGMFYVRLILHTYWWRNLNSWTQLVSSTKP